MTKLHELIQEYTNVKDKLVTAFLEALKVELQGIFREYPELESFHWTQYTNFFNDGEPCYFAYRGMGVGEPDEDGEYEDSKSYELLDELNDTLANTPDIILQDLFGEDSKVTVTKQGIDIQDYSGEHE